ncbi:MAG: 5-(carboxyamino)imidazole ribonucleotide synthase [Vulcanisaeta sp.]|jgi:5-(carboxyamino)imidazole ribonucleotide synthase|nr:5-(carboxyamino)imidazole ribonucleotide synthase [Vulcanisaeta sp.]MDT7969089.1 5-(carboxyamino)imidazole ribonucleotide synthase [Vulcanisaeta sp.]
MPSKTLGILGGGQLGLMMIIEGRKLGVRFYVHDEHEDAPALRVADKAFVGNHWQELVSSSDVVTFEFEHVSPKALAMAHELGKLRPNLTSVLVKQSKIREREFLREVGLPTPRFAVVNSRSELESAMERFGKCVVKVPYGAYDGKGQYYTSNPKELSEVPNQYPLLVDEFVRFSKEISVVLARSASGEVRFYPVIENYNHEGILIYSIAPAQVPDEVETKALRLAKQLAEALNYVGVLAVEFFVTRGGDVLINEFAPRVHNTGHWTLLGSITSQFENHVRAILDYPLGDTELLRPSAIVNILGKPWNEDMANRILSIPGTKIWWYNKAEVRPRRKMGHVNIIANSIGEVRRRVFDVMNIIYGEEAEKILKSPWPKPDM